MKILAIADLHWFTQSDLLSIKTLEYDICVLLGDISENVIRQILLLSGNRSVIAVAGNHDEWNTPEGGGAENIHTKIVECAGYTIAGLSGSVRYKYGDFPMLTQHESLNLCHSMGKADILISHDSGWHMFGKDEPHTGLIGIDYYNLRYGVKLHLCGHHHQPAVRKRFRTTTVCVFRCAITSYPEITVHQVF